MRIQIILIILLLSACVEPKIENDAVDFDTLIDRWESLEEYKITYGMYGGFMGEYTLDGKNMLGEMHKFNDDEKYVISLELFGEKNTISYLIKDGKEFLIESSDSDDIHIEEVYDNEEDGDLIILNMLLLPKDLKNVEIIKVIGLDEVDKRKCTKFVVQPNIEFPEDVEEYFKTGDRIEVCYDHETGLPLLVESQSYSTLLEEYTNDMTWKYIDIKTKTDKSEFDVDLSEVYPSLPKISPERCEVWPMGQGLECVETADALASAGKIAFLVKNQHNYNIQNITFVSSTTCSSMTSSNDPFNTNDMSVITFTDCLLTKGERYNEEFRIKYISAASGQTHESTGIVTGVAR